MSKCTLRAHKHRAVTARIPTHFEAGTNYFDENTPILAFEESDGPDDPDPELPHIDSSDDSDDEAFCINTGRPVRVD